MIRDAIVDEVRAIRDEIAKECGYDVHELFKVLRRLEAGNAIDHVSLVPRGGGPEAAQGNAADEAQATPAPRR
ncbi:hypothetical protein WMF26_02010 [Sorangium sp. So ce185]|uniref:hypothetical protein n=1 Tax=Sorangium sp. So ce185 TaxID=3133287 RepID=UPI003F5EADEE